jgi:hypothetical protein
MATFRHVISESEKPHPIRYRYQNPIGSPQVGQRVHPGRRTCGASIRVGPTPVNDLEKPIQIATVTKPDPYEVAQ